MVLIKPKEECSTAEVYKLFSMERVSTKDPEELLREISQNGISQNVCINDLEPPAFEVLPALKALKERVAAAGRGRYQAVFMSGRSAHWSEDANQISILSARCIPSQLEFGGKK
jgi:4-diphosphocytidyl-2-C-methyl-D-erythritol kinase